jgi:hypothetical protein
VYALTKPKSHRIRRTTPMIRRTLAMALPFPASERLFACRRAVPSKTLFRSFCFCLEEPHDEADKHHYGKNCNYIAHGILLSAVWTCIFMCMLLLERALARSASPLFPAPRRKAIWLHSRRCNPAACCPCRFPIREKTPARRGGREGTETDGEACIHLVANPGSPYALDLTPRNW